MFYCHLCSKEFIITKNLCNKCQRVRHLISIYGDDVFKCLEETLVRSSQQQNFKITKINKKGLNESIVLYDNIERVENSNEKEFKKISVKINKDVLKELKEKIEKK
jgi:hypothetical protein